MPQFGVAHLWWPCVRVPCRALARSFCKRPHRLTLLALYSATHLQREKEVAGSRENWVKLSKQAQHRHLSFDEWLKIKDIDNNTESLPAHLR